MEDAGQSCSQIPGVTVSEFQAKQWDGWGKLKMVVYHGPEKEPEPEKEPDKLEEIYRMIKTLYDAYMAGAALD